MSIVFHCNYCEKRIEAPDTAGGKWGKCPSCHNKLYVPGLNTDDNDELKLAPVDEAEEQKKKKLMAETYKIEQHILLQREEENKTAPQQPSDISDHELTKNVIICLRHMADGNLPEAQQIAKSVSAHKQKTTHILDRIAVSDMPEPELADVPMQVLSGLIKNLRSLIG